LSGGCEECPAVRRLRGIMSNLKDWTVNAKPERFCVLRSYFGVGRVFLVYMMSDARRPRRWLTRPADANAPLAIPHRHSISKLRAAASDQ